MTFPERVIEAVSSTGFVLKKVSGLAMERSLLWGSLTRFAPLLVGEVVSGLCNFAVLVFISRYFGVGALGLYALAQTVGQYAILGMDLGLKSIGARLIAMNRAHAPQIVTGIQRKRVLLAAFWIPLAVFYALWGPIPPQARLLVALFALSTAPHALAIDWILWGMERFVLLGAWRACVTMLFLAITISAIFLAHSDISAVAFANGLSVLIGALSLWRLWQLLLRRDIKGLSREGVEHVDRELSWRSAAWLGLAVVFGQIFQTANILLLGAFSTAVQVGLYNASYKLIFLIMSLFYLATQAMFPSLAKLADRTSARNRVLQLAGLLFLLGAGINLPGQLLSGIIIRILYGEHFAEAAQLLRILLLTIPFHFACGFLGAVLTAWGMFRRTLAVTVVAALASVAVNLYLIPRFDALGASWAMVISYCVYAGAALIAFKAD